MRLTVSILAVVVFYALCVFVSLEFNPIAWGMDGRFWFSLLSSFIFVATYTCPLWWGK